MLKQLTVYITTNWKILQQMGIPDHLTCLLSNAYEGQEATVITGHGTTDCFQIRKGVCQGCILSPWLFNLYAEYIMWNAMLDETQAGIKIEERNISNPRYADDITFMAESEEPLDESERGEWKSWLKTQHSKKEDHGSGPFSSWQVDGGNNGKSDRLYFLRLQNHCRWWLKPWN